MQKPHLLVISHVLPFPGFAGQQRRVFYKLKALRDLFHITFVTYDRSRDPEALRSELLTLCDDVVLLPTVYSASLARRTMHQAAARLYSLYTGLKRSNYIIGQLEFAPSRLAEVIRGRQVDCALFEYWHAAGSTRVLQAQGIPCVLDMHDVLWQSFKRQLEMNPYIPEWWRTLSVARYRQQEERAWRQFDSLIAINAAEEQDARAVVGEDIPIFYTPMGTDLALWPFINAPAHPPRLAFYGGLGNPYNQRDARRCYADVMPIIWRSCPEAELWIVGSNPPADIQALGGHEKVTVTGFVENVQDILRTMSLVLCPWSGTFGFRSRLIEVMALGVPVVASPEAVYGMDMDDARGLFLEETDDGMAMASLRLLNDPELLKQHSKLARAQVEEKFSYEETYERLAADLLAFTCRQQADVASKT